MAPSNPRVIDLAAAALVSLALCLVAALPAHALSTDRQQPIKVDADHFKASRPGTTTLTGHVVITQGTLVATGAKGVAHTGDDNAVERVVLTGAPATAQQALDDGGHMHAEADRIDYHVANDTIELTGHATVVQAGKGRYTGAHLVYNTRTGAIAGEGGEQGRVHLILQPQTSAKPAARPAPASSRGTP
ncbi:MAG TPA: lipopolysaccharide transport periplasmic protein LptA [Rhodanobacteraceae bacterium]|nr:lipopolysaccharide transport periplasmic protein LptA [Rhodanobacteraceae bacterium]